MDELPVVAVLADEIDRALLAALAAGGARSQLWRHFGLPRREVDRRFKRLHRIAAADTLFQLGARSVELGWLEPRP